MTDEDDNKIKSITITGGGSALKGGAVQFSTGEGNEPIDISVVVQKLLAGLQEIQPGAKHVIESGLGIAGGEHGEILFHIGGNGSAPVLRIDGKGVFWLNGKEIGEDREIFVFFRAFLGYVAGGMNRRQGGW